MSRFLCVYFILLREGARVVWGYIDRILGQPSLIRESSRGKYPWSRWLSYKSMSSLFAGKNSQQMKEGKGFGDVILHPALHKRIQHLAAATANTKTHQAPFRNMLFYGPPGTGKTMAAKELSLQSVRWLFSKLIGQTGSDFTI
jgi:ATPase family AAA domain-containing protein 3A/B